MAAYTTVDDSGAFNNTVRWTGNDTARAITGVGFQPDLTWIKNIAVLKPHVIWDAVRTAGGDKELSSDSDGLEGAQASATYGFLSAFDSDGFSLGEGSASDPYVNTTGQTYVGWNWKGGGAGVSNTDGDITSTVSANTTSGFSVVKWSGNSTDDQTVGTGLSSDLGIVFLKSYTGTGKNWIVKPKGFGATDILYLNTTAGTTSSPGDGWISSIANGDGTFTLAEGGSATYPFRNTNETGMDYIAYCFALLQGYSAQGSYTGNGNIDGPFVYTGFRPAWIMVKRLDSTKDWAIFDNKREGYNDVNYAISANTANANDTGTFMDILSNGWKWRSTAGLANTAAAVYIYTAFAESPFVNSNGVPGNAK